MRKKRYLIVIITILLFIAGCSNKNTKESINVSSSNLNETKSLSFYGNVISLENKDIKVEYPIEVEEVFVKSGDYVNKGEPLLKYSLSNIQDSISDLKYDEQEEEIKLQILNSKLNSLVAEKTNLEDQLHDLLKNNTNYVKQLEILKQEKEICNTKLDNATKEYNAVKKLYDKDKSIKSQLADAKITMDELKVDIEELELKEDQLALENTQKIESINKQIDNIKESMEQTKTFDLTTQNLEISKISDKLAELNSIISIAENDKYLISAPYNCVISSVISTEKTEYNEGTTLMEISNSDKKVICIKALEDFAHYFNIGEKISIIFDQAENGRKTGVISSISNMVFSSSSGNVINVYVDVEDMPRDIRIGTTVELELILREDN